MFYVKIADVVAKIETDDPDFESYMKGSYSPAVVNLTELPSGKRADIEVDIEFQKSRGKKAREWIKNNEKRNLVILGSAVRAGEESIYYQYGPYCISVNLRDEILEIKSLFQMIRKFRFEKAFHRERIFDHYQALMRLTTHYPIFYLLETKGWTILHSSLVCAGDKGVLFLGLNGAGKTTTALSLLPQAKLLSDNFVLFDGRRLLPFPEYLRIPHNFTSFFHLKCTGVRIFGKDQAIMNGETMKYRPEPVAMVILKRGDKTIWQEMSRDNAIKYIEAADAFTHEGHRYSFFSFFGGWRNTSYPDCDAYEATLGPFEESIEMIRREVGGLLGIQY